MAKSFVISVLKDDYKVCRLNAFDGIPEWVLDTPLSSITRTAEELSIVCPNQVAPEQLKSEQEWKCLKIHGPLGFDEVGIISSLTKVLADAEISVFVLSTFETDYILVKRMNLEKAAKVLTDNGHEIFFDQMMKKFEFLLGDWDLEYNVPESGFSKKSSGSGVGSIKRALNDKYVYFDYLATLTIGSGAAHAIFAWDEKSRIYRYWWFENSGNFLTATCNFIGDDILFLNWHETLLIQSFTKVNLIKSF